MSKEKFSLKDALFNAQKIEMISKQLKGVYSSFDRDAFTQETVKKFPQLELKERIYYIRDMLFKYLPKNYVKAVTLLLKALPQELDNTQEDDDFGEFIYASYSDFINVYGCNLEHLAFSLQALRKITKRFSVEFAIRDFINEYPRETLAVLEECAKSNNYHERRLASEGLRPKLPWAKKLTIDYHEPLRHLELLYTDKTRYVTRSVANHLNDISKIDAPLVIKTLKHWQDFKAQDSKEMAFIINHSLRSLVKQGDEDALSMLGYIKNPPIILKCVLLKTPTVMIGEALEFELEVNAKNDTMLMLDYIIHFCTKRGTLSHKVHKLKKLSLKKDESVVLKKKHPFRANMTTRKLYEGEHMLEMQINGTVMYREYFELTKG